VIRLVVSETAEDVARAGADAVLAAAQAAAPRAHVALAGGSTPRRAYELIAERGVEWEALELWFGDERALPPDDPESNFAMVAETLLEGLRPPPPVVHRIPGELGAQAAAAEYARELGAHAPADPGGVPVLDLVLLGLGEDGHTASLFPNFPALEVRGVPCVAVLDAPKPPPERVTLTLEVLNAARRTVVLAVGAGKAEAVARALAGPDPAVPASLLEAAELVVDRAAAPER
jgi:6-phosphogluconolactonase